MRYRRILGALAALALLLPTVCAAVSPAAFGFSPAVLAQMTRYGANPAQVRGLLDGIESYIAQEARRYNIRVDALRGSLTQKIIRVPANQRTLENAYAQVESSGKQIVALNSENAALKAQLATLTDAKLRTPALSALAEAQRAIDEGRLEDADARLAVLEPLRLSEAVGANAAWIAVVEMRANVAKLSGDYRRQGEIAEEADRQLTRRENAQHWRLKMIKADAAYLTGSESGDSAAFEEAIRIFKNEALPTAPRNERPNDWAKTQHALGLALAGVGDLGSDASASDQAKSAFDEALKIYSFSQTPADWATVKNDLGTVLEVIGSRQNNSALLAESANAYVDALKVRTQISHPLDWAATKHNQCNLFERQGKVEESAPLLKLAVDACNDALKERRQDLVPVDWADSKHSIANVFVDLGLLEKYMPRFDSARDAYRAALSVYQRDRFPLRWAQSTCGLAMTGAFIAAVERNPAQLDIARTLARDGRLVAAGKSAESVAFCDYVIQFTDQTRAKWQSSPQK